MRRRVLILLFFLMISRASALTNGFTTSLMGWCSFGAVHQNVSESVVTNAAWAIHTNGMQAAGYNYINIDAYWSDGTTNGLGVPNPDSTKFPNGLGPVVTYIHSLGLKAGIYVQGWTTGQDANFTEGIGGHETAAANAIAAWQFDYVEYDFVQNPKQANLTTLRDALAATGRPMIFATDMIGVTSWASSVVNLCRTSQDPDGSLANVLGAMDDYNTQSSYTVPGFWADPSLLQMQARDSALTATEDRSQFYIWCVMGANLQTTCIFSNLTSTNLSTLINPELIAINQDAALQTGTRIARTAGTGGNKDVWKKPLSSGFAVALFNGTSGVSDVTVDFSSFGLSNNVAVVRDAVNRTSLGQATNTYTSTGLASHATSVITLNNVSTNVPGVKYYRSFRFKRLVSQLSNTFPTYE